MQRQSVVVIAPGDEAFVDVEESFDFLGLRYVSCSGDDDGTRGLLCPSRHAAWMANLDCCSSMSIFAEMHRELELLGLRSLNPTSPRGRFSRLCGRCRTGMVDTWTDVSLCACLVLSRAQHGVRA